MTQKNKNLDVVEATKSNNGQKPELSEIKVSPDPKKEGKNFSEVMLKAERLIQLKEKRQRFIAASVKLNDFQSNTTEEDGKSEFILMGEDYNKFSTKNPLIIADVVEFVKSRIAAHLSEVEKDIMNVF